MRFKSTSGWVLLGERRRALPPERVVRARGEAATTFVEILISVIIVAVVFGTIINGYLVGAVKMEWTGYSLAAQSLSAQTVEQARSAVWDISEGKNELTNMVNGNNVVSWSYNAGTSTLTFALTNIMDVPWKSTNSTIATNYVTIRQLSESATTSNTVLLQLVRVDTVWPFMGWGRHSMQYYTNTTCTYVAPDNRDPAMLSE